MFIVTGATGRLGAQIVDRLLERVPAESVGVSVRDVGNAAALAARGVRVRAGDFTDPGTLAHAFEGAEQVLVISASIRGDGAITANHAALDAAHAAGAHRILYTSHQAAAADSLFDPQRVHAAAEAHLAELGVPFVALRNGFYASTLERFAGEARASGRLVAPEDGPFSWTAHEDLAEVAALAMTSSALEASRRRSRRPTRWTSVTSRVCSASNASSCPTTSGRPRRSSGGCRRTWSSSRSACSGPRGAASSR